MISIISPDHKVNYRINSKALMIPKRDGYRNATQVRPKAERLQTLSAQDPENSFFAEFQVNNFQEGELDIGKSRVDLMPGDRLLLVFRSVLKKLEFKTASATVCVHWPQLYTKE